MMSITLAAVCGAPLTDAPLNHTAPGSITTRSPPTRSVIELERMLMSVISMPNGVLFTTLMLASPWAISRLSVKPAAIAAREPLSARM